MWQLPQPMRVKIARPESCSGRAALASRLVAVALDAHAERDDGERQRGGREPRAEGVPHPSAGFDLAAAPHRGGEERREEPGSKGDSERARQGHAVARVRVARRDGGLLAPGSDPHAPSSWTCEKSSSTA